MSIAGGRFMLTGSHKVSAGLLHGRSSKQVPEPFVSYPFFRKNFMSGFSVTDSQPADKA